MVASIFPCQRDQRVPTTRERLTQAFASHGPMRILLETGTESEWVAQTLEAAGHAVIVADPNYAPMYGERTRTIKTDRRDVAALAEANRHGWYRVAHRTSTVQRETKQILRSRRLLVQMRTGAVSLLRALLRQDGYRLSSGSAETVPARVARLTLPAPVQETVATTFRAFVDRHERFGHAGQVSAAIGVVPWEDSSADRRHRGHITKAGPRELRSLLIQAAWVCWRHPGSAALRAWVDRLAARRGRRIAVVALARRLSRILFAIWRDGTTFEAGTLAAA